MALKHVVIGGGTGYIGTCLVQALRQEGARVTIISRKPGPSRLTWKELKASGLPTDVTAAINVAGQNILDPTKRWNNDFKKAVWESRVDTTAALAKAAEQSDAKVFASISGVAYYKTDGREYTEESVCRPYDYLSELCHAWEDAAKFSNDCKIKRVTIRSGVVLGRNGGMIAQTFWPFFFGLGGPIGTGEQYMPWIHAVDLVRLFVHALRHDVHPILNGVAPQLVKNKEFAKAFGGALKRPAVIPLPTFVANILFGNERAKIITEGQKVIPKKVLESGFEYKYSEIEKACSQFSALFQKGPY